MTQCRRHFHCTVSLYACTAMGELFIVCMNWQNKMSDYNFLLYLFDTCTCTFISNGSVDELVHV